MSSGKRPGGLTALAVFNFIFGGLGIVSMLALAALLRFADAALEGASQEERAIIEALQQLGTGPLLAILAVMFVTSALLIASGIGYLKLKKFLGRTVGNIYGVLGLADALVTGVLLPEELGGGITISALVSILYPLLTLFLLNVVFKEDFVH